MANAVAATPNIPISGPYSDDINYIKHKIAYTCIYMYVRMIQLLATNL